MRAFAGKTVLEGEIIPGRVDAGYPELARAARPPRCVISIVRLRATHALAMPRSRSSPTSEAASSITVTAGS